MCGEVYDHHDNQVNKQVNNLVGVATGVFDFKLSKFQKGIPDLVSNLSILNS